MLTLAELNTCSADTFVNLLDGIYEHSPWVAQRTAAARPFATLSALKVALQQTVLRAEADAQLALIRAHPELAGKQAMAGTLTAASTEEQASAGLDGQRNRNGGNNHSDGEAELETLRQLNAAYRARFGFPFVLAVKGHDGQGMPRSAIIATLQRRLRAQEADERAESLRQIGRIAELRLNQRCGHVPTLGAQALAACEALAQWSDTPEGLTCTYLSPSHQRCAAQILQWMRAAGMTAHIDAIGNVVGRYRSDRPDARVLLMGSHYDTVVDAGRYDGRAGITVPLAVVEMLHRTGERLPFHLDLIAFADEEGVRYRHTLLGSRALAGTFDPAWLASLDADGIPLRAALVDAGLHPDAVPTLARSAGELLGFVEVHIEQGPVLLERGLPVGVVTAIAGSCRYQLQLTGVAGHAGTVPMALRRDAAAAAAEIVLLVERRCRATAGVVGTVGQLDVPRGSINVVPGSCRLSLDIRAGDDAVRDAALADILAGIADICARRGIAHTLEPVLRTAATPCAPWLMAQLGAATARAGLEVVSLPSGAGHDGLALAALTDIAMLFVRCGNGGISHHPLETASADDLDVAAGILADFLRHFTPAPAA